MALLKRPDGAKKQKKRLGRGPGSGNGTTAGKGTKGQNARSGGGVRPGFEGGQMPLYRRIARRGFSNYPFKKQHAVINLSTLEKRFASGETVDLETLREKKLIGTHEVLVKILGEGELTKKLTVAGVKVSRSAQAKIEGAGGSVAGVESVATANAEPPVESSPAEEPVADESAPENTTTNEDDE